MLRDDLGELIQTKFAAGVQFTFSQKMQFNHPSRYSINGKRKQKKLVTQQSPVTLHACVIMLFKAANIKKGKEKNIKYKR